ncbi:MULTISPECIES: cysteine--tRNA ligase [Anaerococcus]|uniref:Cysteine--tRNA ligase n=1 Tax=Anaerococcus nagyae TaxID=1755241 RepID=A0A3E2TLF8_9FIRM|nr:MULTISPECIES: cysteine--tRNA ligase [Anaerococcus]MBP2069204.1 cysteinyl-tRNA synthetase [Anaerococcus nagyae]MDU1828815.1 cysteine--tRNA ligase [Anaerococcus sp.]MDU1865178.1 cysteine--tRNA ligase [Anaerococcus sp.]MDU3210860.1 cysteine--tRNA ligase [Anaerococcus sp.]RGB78155.1 cysteine--tRNA ligase [Anaerococcus nagyae]
MKIHNTLTRKTEEFIPIEENKIRMYVCGPTVYDYMHIGNARPLVVFDTFKRYAKFRGYDVTYVVNFTDVDDKIINKSIAEGITTKEVTDKYIKAFMEDASDLNLDEKSTIHPRATELMDEIIKFVEGLIEKDAAYVVDGDVYFRVSKANDYGKLSGKNVADLVHGASNRLESADSSKKESPVDFALWKKTKKEGEISWDSPWGKGRPGWHIECSTMSKNILGETIDIHAGGEDLEFPHHENEIAQSETLNEKTFANYWMHNGMIQVDGTKMSKSLGNFFTLHDIKKEYDLMVIRFWLLTTNYRQPINFTREIIKGASNSLDRINNSVFRLEELLENANNSQIKEDEKALVDQLDSFRDRFIEVMDDDLNTADAITVVFDLVKFANTKISLKNSKELIKAVLDELVELENVLGIENRKKSNDTIDESKIEDLIEQRNQAKKNKDYDKADQIRDELKEMGVAIKDTRDGVKWELI